MIVCYASKPGKKYRLHVSEEGRVSTLCGLEAGQVVPFFPLDKFGAEVEMVWTPDELEPEPEYYFCACCKTRYDKLEPSARTLVNRKYRESSKTLAGQAVELQETGVPA